MEVVSADALPYPLVVAGIFLAVVLCAFLLIALGGFLLHQSRRKALQKQENASNGNKDKAIG